MQMVTVMKIFMKLTMIAKDSDHHDHLLLVLILKIKEVDGEDNDDGDETTTMTMMLMITRREVVGGRDVALLTGLWQQRDSGADED